MSRVVDKCPCGHSRGDHLMSDGSCAGTTCGCKAYTAAEPCESAALINGRPKLCDRPSGHTGSHFHEGPNLTVGWENR